MTWPPSKQKATRRSFAIDEVAFYGTPNSERIVRGVIRIDRVRRVDDTSKRDRRRNDTLRLQRSDLARTVRRGDLPALDDGGVDIDEIDALYFGNAMGGQTENDTHLAPTIASHIGCAGVPAQRFEDACATSSNAFKHAVEAVEAGLHDTVLVGGVERCTPETGLGTGAMTRVFASASHRQYEQPSGLTFPGVFGLQIGRAHV